MALSHAPLSPIAQQQFLTHTPPSLSNRRPTKRNSVEGSLTRTPPSVSSRTSKRNSVHWDKNDLDIYVKENTAPEALSHIDSPKSHRLESLRVGVSKPSQETHLDFADRRFRSQRRRPQLAAETFLAPERLTETNHDPLGDHELVRTARRLDLQENIFEKHKRRQYQWVLSLPDLTGSDFNESLDSASDCCSQHIPGEGERRYFGCNLLTWTKPAGEEDQLPGGPADKYLILATPIDLTPDQSTTASLKFTTHQFRVLQQETEDMQKASARGSGTPNGVAASAYRPSPLSATSAHWSTGAEASEDSDHTLTVDATREMQEPLSTIEDSFEELDHLEEEIEAIAAAATRVTLEDQLDRKNRMREDQSSSLPDGSTKKASPTNRPSQRIRKAEPQRTIPTRDSSSVTDSDQVTRRSIPTATLRKVARPASLAPPKPIQKATKQPTISTFELPGERVARELKEKKAARLSMQVDPQKAAEASPPQRTRSIRSSKPPTVPNFELPGERYSRQKKERLEQKLREEEEEMRRRRQFRAKPPPGAAAPPTVRSTFTSRQRQTPGAQSEQGSSLSPTAESSPRSGAAKRQSVTMTPSAVRTFSMASTSTVSTAGRSRNSSIGSTKVSTRATSSAGGSVGSSSKRDTMSVEEVQQQKVRGRRIFDRDNTVGQSKEQEKRDREEAMKLARQKYAQMSRNVATQVRARRNQQQSSSCADDDASASPKRAPRVPEHVYGVDRN